ncbi:MAG: 30S ribosomal protein S20 [Chitinophagales bacterium]|nr:30S ribosomal protein S20 [Chitinophagales bacterium]MCO5281133.1 30S ribosomal protein S20 [Chitinophagales bacterium]OJV31226.1 MAG: 30S ribosomal protein S20 [Bacteroidetes bacterium 37-13]HRN94560.1 30S ribosomal protein S20 [Chitinophagales bacterium]HRP40470.1 30S ribosomal protein S20 [Chitinophagales bacterium]
MAHHKSAQKRIRQTAKRRLENRYFAKTMRNALRDFRASTKKEDLTKALPKVASLIDKLAKRGYIHQNKAANLKSSIAKKANNTK